MSDQWPPPGGDPTAHDPRQWSPVPPAAPPVASPPPLAPPAPTWADAPTPPGGAAVEPDGRKRWLVAGAIAVVVALLLGGVAWAVTRDDEDPPRQDASAQTNEATPTTPPQDEEGEGEPAVEEEPDEPVELDPDSMMVPTGNDEMDTAIQDLARFVEEARGLTFTEEVVVEALPTDEFVSRLREELDSDEEYLEYLDLLGDRLVAVGLISPESDPVATYLSLLDQGVLGFYDPESGELVVRGTDPSLFLQSTIVHELTHALDDQHFELDRPEVEENDEHSFGFSALVEGNARTVENLWRDELSASDEAQLSAEELAFSMGVDPADLGLDGLGDLGAPEDLFGDLDGLLDGLGGLDGEGLEGFDDLEELFGDLDSLLGELDGLFEGLDSGGLDDFDFDLDGMLEDFDLDSLLGGGDLAGVMVLQEILMAPYEDGSALVEVLLDEGGMGRVDEAYDAPPISSEQVLDPDRYLAGDEIEEVAVPEADGPATNDGWMGQFFLRLLLEQVFSDDEAADAVEGWAGDRFVQWDEGSRHCLRLDVAMDTASDREELADALAEWADAQADATSSTEGDLVRVTSCN